MFKDDFKAANDAIHADEELINKVLALQDPIKRQAYQKQRRKTNVRAYIPAAAAAMFLIVGSAASVPFLTRTADDDGVINSSSYYSDSLNGKEPENAADKSTNAPQSDNKVSSNTQNTQDASSQGNTSSQSVSTNSESTSENTQKRASEIVSEDIQKSASENLPEGLSESTPEKSYEGTAQSKNRLYVPDSNSSETSKSYDIPSSEDTDIDKSDNASDNTLDNALNNVSSDISDNAASGNAEYSSDEVASRSRSMDRGKIAAPVDNIDEKVVLSMNSMPYTAEAFDLQQNSSVLTQELNFEEWTYRDYFDYLGITLNPVLPFDFAMTGHEAYAITDESLLDESFEITTDEYGTPIFDNKSFAFAGDGDRYVTIQTTKDTSVAMTYLTDSDFSHSKIGSSYGVLIGTTDNCICYMISGGCAYVINSVGLDEHELKALLLSVEES